MPFIKLRVGKKRTGRYDLSRDLYVIAVHLLDGHVLQCTLSTESTGKECMDYVCQRLELRQNIFFGLRYKCARVQVHRWVELDKPLRKQLEKTTQDFRLYFGVMFHTPNGNSLTDLVARYYYFLQMRADVLDGRLLVSPERAISLASYSLQIDFGDHDEARPTVDTLRGKPLLPRHMTQSSQILEDLIRQVLVGYRSLRGLSRSQAELLYITEARQCDGYGVEYFSGRDEDNCEVFVGYCMDGIVVKRLQGPPVKYKWEEIVSIMANRRNFIVNCAELAQAHFQMEDVETAKYAAYVAGLHLQFFRNFCKHDAANNSAACNNNSNSNNIAASLIATTNMNNNANGQNMAMSPLINDQQDQVYAAEEVVSTNCCASALCMHQMHQQQQQQQQFMTSMVLNNNRCTNGFPDAAFPANGLYMDGGGVCGLECTGPYPAPLSYSTTSVDQLAPPTLPIIDNHQHHQSIAHLHQHLHHQNHHQGHQGHGPPPMPAPTVSSPFNPSVSSLTTTSPTPVPAPAAGMVAQRRRLLAATTTTDGLQSWMSQQILPTNNNSDASGSLNRRGHNNNNGGMGGLLNGSVPGIQLASNYSAAGVRTNNHNHNPAAAINGGGRIWHHHQQNGPGRPLSLDEFNINEMLRTAYELQQQQQQSMHHQHYHYRNHNQYQSGSDYHLLAHSRQHLPTTTTSSVFGGSSQQLATAPLPLPAPMTESAAHPGARYLASLGAYLNSKGADLSSQNLYNQNQNQYNQKKFCPPIPAPMSDGVAAEIEDAERNNPAAAEDRPCSAAAVSLNNGCGAGAGCDLSLSKSQSSPDLIEKRRNSSILRRRGRGVRGGGPSGLPVGNLKDPQTDVGPSFRNLSVEEELPPDEESYRRRNNGGQKQQHQQAIPQRIIVGGHGSSESDSEPEPEGGVVRLEGEPSTSGVHQQQQQQPNPKEEGQHQTAFQRFNPKLYERHLITQQRQHQMHYRQQVEKERTNSRKEEQEYEEPGQQGQGQDLDRRRNRDRDRGKAAHRHCLLVNDHGGSSSEEALRTPDASWHEETPDTPVTPETGAGAGAGTPQGPYHMQDQDYGLLRSEFEQIPRKRVSAGSSTAQRVENQRLNRDPAVLPYEDNRVMLRPNGANPMGYINASHVQVRISQQTGLMNYIVAQNPLAETVVDFWRMIWDAGCRVIVMLGSCQEGGDERCFPYWPCGRSSKMTLGEYQLSSSTFAESRGHTTSTILLKHQGTGQKRLLYHLQYSDWSEDVPAGVDTFLSFIDQVRGVKWHVTNQLMKSSSISSSSSGFGAGAGVGGSSNGSGGSRANLLESGGDSGRKRSTTSSNRGSVIGLTDNQYGDQVGTLASATTINNELQDSRTPPLMVHCGTGAGRTGLYMLTELMIHASQQNQDLDMARALTALRHQRMFLVQSYSQYHFVHACLNEYTRKSRLI